MQKPHWIAFGPEEAWNIALLKHKGIWGIRERFYPEWKALENDDIMFFFITKTIKGVVGVGRIGNKFIQDKPLWPDEKKEGIVIYPLRFEFNIDYLLEALAKVLN